MNQNNSYTVPSYPQLNQEKSNNYSELNQKLIPNKNNLNVNQSKHLLFYSTFCNNCKELMEFIKKKNCMEKVELICIDYRFIKDNIIYIKLENNQTMPLPPMINRVPTLCILPNHEILEGKKIQNYFNPISENIVQEREKIDLEPNPFSLEKETIGNYGVSSDNFSFWDMQSNDLTASGSGGERQMYNYSSVIKNNTEEIYTPQEEASTDKINMTLEELQEKRKNDI